MKESRGISRRDALKGTGAVLLAAGAIDTIGPLASIPARAADSGQLPDIQFDINPFTASLPQTENGVTFQMPPVHTVFLTASLTRTPVKKDQAMLAQTLKTIERAYPFNAKNIITIISYGIPYFSRLPGGMTGPLIAAHLPRLLSDNTRFALEEAVPAPTDTTPHNPFGVKQLFDVPVVIESNDILLTIKSDDARHIGDVLAWLEGSNRLRGRVVPSPRAFGELITITSSRYQFIQRGLPRAVADQNLLPFAPYIQPESPMWMGFIDQHVNAFGPSAICTFAGNPSARFTTAVRGDYFDNASIQHLSHVIIDMLQWLDMLTPTTPPDTDGTYVQRIQYMFHAPNIYPGNTNQFTDGGGTAFVPDDNRGPDYATQTAQGIGTNISPQTGQPERRMGHLSTLQRSSRAADGTPIHFRMDGPGFDSMDVPDGSKQPKNQFSMFVPTADFFATMRTNMASLDLCQQYGVQSIFQGLDRFLTTTRRQNFLCPPRRHRAFPLLELPTD